MHNTAVALCLCLLACDSPGATGSVSVDADRACRAAWTKVCDNDRECNTLTGPDYTLCDDIDGFNMDAQCRRADEVSWSACNAAVDNSVCPRDNVDEVNGFNAAVILACSPPRPCRGADCPDAR